MSITIQFSSNASVQTWVIPENVVGNSIIVECWAAGGAGGGRAGSNAASGGGGGGAYSANTIIAGNGTSFNIFVPVGPSGGTSSGTAGGNAYFSYTSNNTALCLAQGGNGGANSGANGPGGAGGATNNCVGNATMRFAGGNGATGNNATGGAGGGGGGGAGNNAGGNWASNYVGAGGGNANPGTGNGRGGDGRNNVNGNAANNYGGGGGGAKRTSGNRSGGAGGSGFVRLTYDLAIPDTLSGNEAGNVGANLALPDSLNSNEVLASAIMFRSQFANRAGAVSWQDRTGVKWDLMGLSVTGVETGNAVDSVSDAQVLVSISDFGVAGETLGLGVPGTTRFHQRVSGPGFVERTSVFWNADAATSFLLVDPSSGSDAIYELTSALSLSDSCSGSDGVSTSSGTRSVDFSDICSAQEILTISGIGRPKFRHRPGLFVWMDSTDLFWDSDTMTYVVSDSGSFSDGIQVTTGAPISVSDSATGADAFKSLSVGIPVSDAMSGADIPQVLTAQLTRTDSASAADAIQSLQVSLGLSDSGTASDNAIAYGYPINVPVDTLAGADSIGQITASMSLPDSATEADSPSIEASLGVVDVGMGVDAALNLTEIVLQDTASGVDSFGTTFVEATVQDSSTGDDQITDLSVSLDIIDDTLHAWELIIASGTEMIFVEEITSAEIVEVTADLGVLEDAGVSIDQPIAEASLSLDDAVLGDDQLASVGQSLHISVDDSAMGADEAPEFTIYVPLADSTYGADLPAMPLAGFSLPDSGRGYDASINWTLLHTYRRLRVRFTAKKPGIVFNPRKPGANFTGRF